MWVSGGQCVGECMGGSVQVRGERDRQWEGVRRTFRGRYAIQMDTSHWYGSWLIDMGHSGLFPRHFKKLH